MKAVINNEYGPPDLLELQEIDRPEVDAGGVLVRVHASSVNPLDWHLMRGLPYLGRLTGCGVRRPKITVRGVDVAGQVEAVGEDARGSSLATRFSAAATAPSRSMSAHPRRS